MLRISPDQGSALSPLLFIMVMDFLTEDVRNGSLMELLYADNLVFCGCSDNYMDCPRKLVSTKGYYKGDTFQHFLL